MGMLTGAQIKQDCFSVSLCYYSSRRMRTKTLTANQQNICMRSLGWNKKCGGVSASMAGVSPCAPGCPTARERRGHGCAIRKLFFLSRCMSWELKNCTPACKLWVREMSYFSFLLLHAAYEHFKLIRVRRRRSQSLPSIQLLTNRSTFIKRKKNIELKAH